MLKATVTIEREDGTVVIRHTVPIWQSGLALSWRAPAGCEFVADLDEGTVLTGFTFFTDVEQAMRVKP